MYLDSVGGTKKIFYFVYKLAILIQNKLQSFYSQSELCHTYAIDETNQLWQAHLWKPQDSELKALYCHDSQRSSLSSNFFSEGEIKN